MADATGEPATANEVPEEKSPEQNGETGGEITEQNVTEKSPENNALDGEAVKDETVKDETEATNNEPKSDEQTEAEPTENKENFEPEEIKERVDSQEQYEIKERTSDDEFKPDIENVENEEMLEKQLGEDAEKGQIEGEIAGEEKVDKGEEEVGGEHVESEEKKEDEAVYEEIEEEIENEDGTKTIKKIKRQKPKPEETEETKETEQVPLEQVMVEAEEEELVKEESKEAEEPPKDEYDIGYIEEEIPEELPPDPAAPLDFSDSKEALKPPFRLRPDQIAEVESLWELYQNYTPVYSDIDGYITEKELVYMLKCLLLMTYTEEQLQELIAFVVRPPHPKGHINYQQFLKMVTLRQRDLPIEEELRQAMKVMDFDNVGSVERDFFRETLITKGYRLTSRMVDVLIKDVDLTNDGTLGVEDVVGTMCMDLNPDDLELLRKAVYPDENMSNAEEQQEEEEAPVEDTGTNDEDDDDD